MYVSHFKEASAPPPDYEDINTLPDYGTSTSVAEGITPTLFEVPDDYDKVIISKLIIELKVLMLLILNKSDDYRFYTYNERITSFINKLPYSYMICNKKMIISTINNEINYMINKDINFINVEYIKYIVKENITSKYNIQKNINGRNIKIINNNKISIIVVVLVFLVLMLTLIKIIF